MVSSRFCYYNVVPVFISCANQHPSTSKILTFSHRQATLCHFSPSRCHTVPAVRCPFVKSGGCSTHERLLLRTSSSSRETWRSLSSGVMFCNSIAPGTCRSTSHICLQCCRFSGLRHCMFPMCVFRR